MTIPEYLDRINTRYQTGISREHSYRGDLQTLLESLVQDVLVTNEPARVACGAPDYIITRRDIPVGYIEAKDLGKPLNSKDYKDQFDRYKASLSNLIITDYLDFWLFKEGELVTTLKIAEIKDGQVTPLPQNFALFKAFIIDFCQFKGVTLKSPAKLATMMADKAKFLAQIIERALSVEGDAYENRTLHDQLQAFKVVLLHEITPREFSDIYAQTVAYGMFAARLHDPTLPTFSRQEAAELIPKTNPFLRKLFGYIAGPDIDDRIKWIVDALADVFRATDIKAILKNFGRSTQTHDPIIHFYETFLAEYDPALRKSRGVWYTPEPVVNFIVRAVDDILKTEFGLKDGLASTETTEIEVTTQLTDRRTKDNVKKAKQTVHKVQVLDPATGTGTFLAEVVKHVYGRFEGQEGIWSQYVERHLLPRLNGFEILMASYAMCHLKLDLLLQETGYVPQSPRRFKVYLTNSLEEAVPSQLNLFASWLSDEAMQANAVKRETPVMVVLGNPPYSGESQNKGKWIMDLMEDYKKEPGGKEKLKEKNSKWINDDYVKFLRFGQHFIEQNGEGILAFINPHGFLDNPTFRGMRWNLLKTYDKIYTLDLHGNGKKKETAPDGSIDVNVFGIMQGVSINLFMKTGKKKPNELGKVFHYDLFGKRESKYDFLNQETLNSIRFTELDVGGPNYFFVRKDYDTLTVYNEGIYLKDLFVVNSIGLVTARDEFTLHDSKEKVKSIVEDFLGLENEVARTRFSLGKDVRDWSVEFAKKDLLSSGPDFNKIVPISYRPFDTKYTYFTGKSKGFHCMPRGEVMQHFLKGPNIALNLCKMGRSIDSHNYFLSDKITDKNLTSSLDSVNTFPLYLYPEIKEQTQLDGLKAVRTPNLDPKVVQKIAEGLGLTFVPEKEGEGKVCFAQSLEVRPEFRQIFAPLDLLDYIYAVLHSPSYRERYKEFLKIDFPRVPNPQDAEQFWQLAALGGELRQLHLLEHLAVRKPITQYPLAGDNVVTKIRFEENYEILEKDCISLIEPVYRSGRVYINETQFFQQVPLQAWEFYIGGYQPAQKWLKDRKGRELQFDDIVHYQRMIVALFKTAELMWEIDKVLAPEKTEDVLS
ncbi:DNA methyltransferase [Rufibacter immobilis]|uniref:site-specific DNA-methyltransferase (adenine-specific) n=1 Tax=Rufibacter immobilis TaxID=1348778 RepID=A0A3M9MVY0_9BACT|nr:type ISP restriction/modification enzyme [Rufibacter immobilis]RNI28918.1 DNA methyltransferase [Rufibacter immobilis]